MGNTSFIVLRTARQDLPGPTESRTQFAELTGAYWLEPIYAGLANEWNRQGRSVPGAPREHRRVLPDGSPESGSPDTHAQLQPREETQSSEENGTSDETQRRDTAQRYDDAQRYGESHTPPGPALDGPGSRPALLSGDVPE